MRSQCASQAGTPRLELALKELAPIACLWPLLLAVDTACAAVDQPPRLVVQITVDQLRGDMLERYRHRFGEDGFRRLLDGGLVFTNAHYATSNTGTCAGHAVLVTGADTAGHGIVSNHWFDTATGKRRSCVNDPRHRVLDQLQSEDGGKSPDSLSSSTIGDALVETREGSRSFAVAGKDTSAIISGGRRAKAFWVSFQSGRIVSSTYYFDRLPDWVDAWNGRNPPQRYDGRQWTPVRDAASYRFAADSANVHARPNPSLGRTFPHPLPEPTDARFVGALIYTPYLDEITADFARELIVREGIGRSGTTDFLAVGFSANDHVGHAYGPDSVEYEDNLLRLDAILASFLSFIDERIGADHILVVLSADHGVDAIPERRTSQGKSGGRLYPEAMRTRANAALKSRFGIQDDLVIDVLVPGAYLDHARIAKLGLSSREVADALAEELARVQGVALAVTRTALIERRLARTPMLEKLYKGFHPERSGDVVLVQEASWYLDYDPEKSAATHGSPHVYDTFVPIIFAGGGLKPRTVNRAVEPASIAPTIAALLSIEPPEEAKAPVLREVVAF